MSDTVSRDFDQAVNQWASEQLGVAVTKVRLEPDINCYSSWTCDYEVAVVAETEQGERWIDGWTFPTVLKQFTQWMDAHEAMLVEHAEYHGWDDDNE